VRTLAGHVGEARTELACRAVEDLGDGADLVAAELALRPAEIAGAVASRHVGDGADAAVQALRRDAGQHHRHEQADAETRQGAATDARDLAVHGGQRQRRAHEGDRAVVVHGHRGVHRPDAGRVAEPLCAAGAVAEGALDLVPREVVLERGQVAALDFGIAEHAAVGGDEGHAGGREPAEAIGFGVEIGRRWPPLEERAEQPGFVEQRRFDVRGHPGGDQPLDRPGRHGERQHRRQQDAEEDAGAEGHGSGGRSSSL